MTGRTRLAIIAAVAGLLVAFAAIGIFISGAVRLEQEEHLTQNELLARAVAVAIEAREDGYLKVLSAYAGRFRFREAIAKQNRAEALVHLRQLREMVPELDLAAVFDPAGVAWATYPESPSVYGQSFSHRDWYQGVSRQWRPYMSDVFPAATGRGPIVVLALPVRDPDGRVIGIMTSAQRLTAIRQWLLPIEVEGGDLYLVDRKGQLVFHRSRASPEQIGDYAKVPVVQALLRREQGKGETHNPVEGDVRLTAYRPLPSLGWGLVVQQNKNAALGRIHALMVVSAAAGLVLALTLAALASVALRNQRETAAALAELAEKTRALGSVQEELVRKERLAVLGQLAGGVGHELRNPLGVIKNSVFYLRMVLPEEQRVQKHLQILEREVRSANRIISDLLDFARLRPPVRTPVSLNALVWDVLDRMPPAENVKVVLALAEEMPPVSADPDQLMQVLGNLVTNATQAMPEGGTLRIETARSEGEVLVAVSDTGIGIPAEHRDQIFQPLFTTKAKGIGLGLALSRNLVEANGGAIHVESTPGRGSSFTVRFPAAPAE